MPNTLLYNMNISRVYQYSNKNISKSIYNISKCITIFYVCQYWWCFHSRTLCTCSHVKYGMKKWTLLFPVLISIKVNELSSRVPETFSLQFDQWFLKLLCSWAGRYHFLIFSLGLALQKQTNKQKFQWHALRGNTRRTRAVLSGEGGLPPFLPHHRTQQHPVWVWAGG